MAKRPELEILTGQLAGKRFVIPAGGLRLGRSSSNDIHVPDEQLSRNHCLFEVVGESGIRLTDLASANGTCLNGNPIGADPVILSPGDRILAGETELKVIDPDRPVEPQKVDLGLNAETASSLPTPKRRQPLANALWGVFALIVVAAIIVVLRMPVPEEPQPKAVVEKEPQLREFSYEKVDADSKGIFRYALALSADGVLRVVVDDVPGENRHVSKAKPLGETALKELGSILAFRGLKEIDREYAGAEPDPPALSSASLRVVYDTRARAIRITNTQEPDAFRPIREALEVFAKNELGIWAIQYSSEKLVALATECLELSRAKWEDRDVKYGNVFESMTAAREALYYLETVNPKPPIAAEAKDCLDRAKSELEKRYADQNFIAERAQKLGQWEAARAELSVLLEMVPDRKDDRYLNVSARLIDVEKRLKKGGK